MKNARHAVKDRHPESGALAALYDSLSADRGSAPSYLLSRLALCAALALLALAALAPAAAQASQSRLFAGTFGAGSSLTPNPYPIGDGNNAVAADSSAGPSQGDLYVTDAANHRVEKFDSSGNFLLMFGKEVNSGTGNPDVCTNAGSPTDVCQPGAATEDPGALREPTVIAVDNSSGPSAGDVYVDAGFKPGRNEVQVVKLSGAGGGTFTLTFEGQTTVPISFEASANELAEALEHLTSIGTENVGVQAGQNGPGTWGIYFKRELGSEDVPLLTADASGLTPAGATATVSTETQGAAPVPDRVAKYSPDGQPIASWAAGGELDGSAAPGGPFLAPIGIAVDPAGNLWDLSRGQTAPGLVFNQAFQFDQGANYLGGWSGPPSGGQGVGKEGVGLGVDAEDNLYFSVEGEGFLLEFTPTGTRIGSVVDTSHLGGALGIQRYAIDQADAQLFVSVQTAAGPTEIQRYPLASCQPSGNDHPCTPAEAFGADRLPGGQGGYPGLAVDPSSPADPVYVLRGGHETSGGGHIPSQLTAFKVATVPDATTIKASGFTASTATLNGSVNPEGVPLTQCFFEWGESASYGNTAPCEPSAGAIGSGTTPVHAQVPIEAGKTYHFRLLASNEATDIAEEPARGQDLRFGPPLIEAGSALAVSATDAILQLQVNPQSVETHARIEYGTEAGNYTEMTAEVDLGAAESTQSASFKLGGLVPNTTYHYRISAESLLGSPLGEDLSFTTQSTATLPPLPDNRGYELVSPPDKHGVPLEAIGEIGPVIQAAADGSAISYGANGSIGAGAAGNRSTNISQLLSARGPAGWSTADISTPHQDPAGVTVGSRSEYQLFSSDLSRAALEPRGTTPLSPLATEDTPYTPYLRQPGGEYTPLVYPGNAPEGTELFKADVKFSTASPDLGHILIQSRLALTADFSEGFRPKEKSVYEWSAGALSLVSQVPPGGASLCGGSGPACLPAAEVGQSSSVGNRDRQVRNAISTDGSRVVFAAGKENTNLYLRGLSTEETIQLDAAEPTCLAAHKCQSGDSTFQDASTDGSRVFFTDGNRLTANSTANGQREPDLYMCEIEVDEEEHLACDLIDLSANNLDPTEPAAVLGDVIGASDGSFVYFVANGALTEGAVRGDCSGVAGTSVCNLYRYDVDSEAAHQVAVLSGNDFHDWSAENFGQDLSELTARVSPNGRWLAFMSERPLTGYDNRDAASGRRDEEVFLYDAAADGGQGRLLCASCNPSGARPAGRQGPPNVPAALVDKPRNWETRWYAANIPGWTSYALEEARYQSRYLSNRGRLFFNSADALVPQDSNGTEDVYEFEPPGVGGCTEASPAFAPRNGGCLGLISSGTSKEESAFMDASETGDDVFFLTAARLTGKDVDGAYDLYDARVGGGEPEPVKAVECNGDACQLPAVPPNHPTPGTLLLNGPENEHPVAKPHCARGKVKRHGRCVAKKHHGARHRRANSKRRGHK